MQHALVDAARRWDWSHVAGSCAIAVMRRPERERDPVVTISSTRASFTRVRLHPYRETRNPIWRSARKGSTRLAPTSMRSTRRGGDTRVGRAVARNVGGRGSAWSLRRRRPRSWPSCARLVEPIEPLRQKATEGHGIRQGADLASAPGRDAPTEREPTPGDVVAQRPLRPRTRGPYCGVRSRGSRGMGGGGRSGAPAERVRNVLRAEPSADAITCPSRAGHTRRTRRRRGPGPGVTAVRFGTTRSSTTRSSSVGGDGPGNRSRPQVSRLKDNSTARSHDVAQRRPRSACPWPCRRGDTGHPASANDAEAKLTRRSRPDAPSWSRAMSAGGLLVVGDRRSALWLAVFHPLVAPDGTTSNEAMGTETHGSRPLHGVDRLPAGGSARRVGLLGESCTRPLAALAGIIVLDRLSLVADRPVVAPTTARNHRAPGATCSPRSCGRCAVRLAGALAP